MDAVTITQFGFFIFFQTALICVAVATLIVTIKKSSKEKD